MQRSPADLREVANYVLALEHGVKRLRTLPLSLRFTRELHANLMTGVRGDRAMSGEFRTAQNWIGTPGCTLTNATYVPPPPAEVMGCLGDWEKFVHDRSLPVLVQAGILHSQFEAIHPFLDGNGRVGRLLIILFLIERGVLPSPLLYLSAFFEATRHEYYERLLGVTERGEWEQWLTYFLHGVARQSEDVLKRAERINTLLARWKERVTGTSQAARLVDLLAENPYCTIGGAAKRLRVAFTTAQRAMAKLEDVGILRPVKRARRDRVFYARALLEILEAPANLVPEETA